MEEGRVMSSVLLDFYGNMLTDKQRQCIELHYNEDLSLAEIAEQSGISRQGVWDNIRRADASLRELEEKTGLAALFLSQQKQLEEIKDVLEKLRFVASGEARELADEALRRIEALGREEREDGI